MSAAKLASRRWQPSSPSALAMRCEGRLEQAAWEASAPHPAHAVLHHYTGNSCMRGSVHMNSLLGAAFPSQCCCRRTGEALHAHIDRMIGEQRARTLMSPGAHRPRCRCLYRRRLAGRRGRLLGLRGGGAVCAARQRRGRRRHYRHRSAAAARRGCGADRRRWRRRAWHGPRGCWPRLLLVPALHAQDN